MSSIFTTDIIGWYTTTLTDPWRAGRFCGVCAFWFQILVLRLCDHGYRKCQGNDLAAGEDGIHILML